MCGIIGKYLYKSEPIVIDRLKHRGPDHQEVVEWGNFHVGHTRLSIIDPNSVANQPFEFKDTILAFNGEIYNYKELREEYLTGKQIISGNEFNFTDEDFRTNSDTEVLSQMLFYYGIEKTLGVLQGIFGFFYADNGNNRILVRDKYGEIPLFYEENGNGFIWSSEQKGFNKHMTEFPCANYYDFNTGEFVKYYDYVTDNYKSFTIEVMEDAVKKQLVADAPLCCLISGG